MLKMAIGKVWSLIYRFRDQADDNTFNNLPPCCKLLRSRKCYIMDPYMFKIEQ